MVIGRYRNDVRSRFAFLIVALAFGCGDDTSPTGGGGEGASGTQTASSTSVGAGGAGGEGGSGGLGEGGAGGTVADGGAGGSIADGGGGAAFALAVGDIAPDFSLIDQNTASPTVGLAVSPSDYLGRVSGWYFGHAT